MSKTVLAILTAAALATGGAAAIQTVTPGIAVSNRLTPAKDARVLRFTLTPKASWSGPYRWRTSINGTDTITTIDTSRVMVDTVFRAFPTCAVYRATVYPAKVNGVVKKDSLTKKVSVCRAETIGEIAFRDSFPDNSFRIIVCGKFQYKPIDSTNTGPPWKDSVPIIVKPDTVHMLVGHMAKFATVMKNRYTGAVILMGGNADPLCEQTRAQMETERGG